ncbi:MAG: glycosyltransferase [Calditrichaeota bacterium]|nr:glycosyltransferase [Calditrichota bacterium]MCB9366003.1 glycosyltransferase [Calditrichota bacterium]MCB9391871.1 glycosyltransferase [Calditrichota bacterium]
MSASTHIRDILPQLARDIQAARHEHALLKRWAAAFLAAEQTDDPRCQLALLNASFPAPVQHPEWYAHFAMLAEELQKHERISLLSESEVARLQTLRARFAAFAGVFRATATATNLSPWVRTRDELRIGIDIRPLSIASSRNRGIGRYLINTLTWFLKLPGKHRFILLGDRQAIEDQALREMFASPRVEFRELASGCDSDLDVFVVTDPCPMLQGRRTSQLPVTRCAWMSIVYDFIPLEFPDLYLSSNPVLMDEYLENIETLGRKCAAFFPISKYVGEQCGSILGANEDNVIPLMGGVEQCFLDASSSAAPRSISDPYLLYVGGADARKNLVGLVMAFDTALPKLPVNTKLVLAGEMNRERVQDLLRGVKLEHLANSVIGLGSVSDEKLIELYSNAIATVFVSLSEGLGLPALEAMACGCPVVTSNGSALVETVGEDAILVDPRSVPSIAEGIVEAATNHALRENLIARGRKRAESWKWEDVARRLLEGIESQVCEAPQLKRERRRMRVAMLNRENVWDAPGGDGRIMLQMKEAAQLQDVEIFFPSRDEDVAGADLIHAVNLTLPGVMQKSMTLAKAYRIPLVVTTLYEDWPQYLNVSHAVFALFQQHLSGRLPFSDLTKRFANLRETVSGPRLSGTNALDDAALFLACGESEALRLSADFPHLEERVRVLPFAVNIPLPAEEQSLAALRERMGVEHFVLSIGRLETRKNQLMLLAALHETDIPIVFAAGSFTPQPAYRAAVHAWKRKAPTMFVERLSWPALSTLIRASSVHVLPSFYELPGLVHLECASAGIPIVASNWGALEDYLPAGAFHCCEPDSPDSIREAVFAALARPAPQITADLASSYSLERLADGLADAYEKVLSRTTYKHNSIRNATRAEALAALTGGLHAHVDSL